jgi:hypothetical protein
MRSFSDFLHLASLAALLACAVAYAYGYLYRPQGFRPLHVASLCFTGMALMQLVLFLYSSAGGRLNADYAVALLALSALAQAAVAVRGRSGRRDRAEGAADGEARRAAGG